MDDVNDLIDLLCTQAGMIFEDISEVALVRSASASQIERIERIRVAAIDANAIAQAAEVLIRRQN